MPSLFPCLWKTCLPFCLDTQSSMLRKRTPKMTKVVLFGHWLLWPHQQRSEWTRPLVYLAHANWRLRSGDRRSITAIPTNIKVQWNWTFLKSCLCKVTWDREVSIVATINVVVLVKSWGWGEWGPTRAGITLSLSHMVRHPRCVFINYEGRLISNAHSEISRKRDHVFKQTKAGSKVQYFSYKLTYLFFDIVALSFNTFFQK